MGKTDRALWVGALSMLAFIEERTMRFWTIFFAILAGVALVTCMHRLGRALIELADRK